MQKMDRIFGLTQQLELVRESIGAIVDPVTRTALQEAVAVIGRVAGDPSLKVEPRSRDEALTTLMRTMAMLQDASERNRRGMRLESSRPD
jgi:hypothetical protein